VRRRFVLTFALLLSLRVAAQSTAASAPQIIDFSSGKLHLKGFLWKPAGPGPFPAVLFNHGSGGGDAAHTAGMTMTEAAARLGPLFVKHGYVFLLKQEESAKGKEARQRLHLALVTGDQLDDVLAALSFLKTAPGVDTHRIAVVGHSLGGVLTLIAAEHDNSVRAAVTFGAGANSWVSSSELRQRLLAAVGKASAPIMLIHAENDYSTAPGRDLAAELERLHRPHVLKIYPAVGKTPDDGHNALYEAIPLWEADVFGFLDEHDNEHDDEHARR
jgi:dipeptidyl aminopeptidase/acylaminoacyl peptidase